jgi:hypothetical protein
MFTSTIRLFIPPHPTPEPGIPLGVWASPLELPHDDAAAPPWLSRLIADYVPAGQAVDLYFPGNVVNAGAAANRQSNQPDQTASAAADAEPRPPAGLVVALLHQQAMSAETFALHVRAAAQAVDACGRLATVTGPSLSTKRGGYDPICRAIGVTAELGFGYLQHVIVTDPHHLQPDPAGAAKPRRAGLLRHRTAHWDVAIFQAPAASPSDGDGQ